MTSEVGRSEIKIFIATLIVTCVCPNNGKALSGLTNRHGNRVPASLPCGLNQFKDRQGIILKVTKLDCLSACATNENYFRRPAAKRCWGIYELDGRDFFK